MRSDSEWVRAMFQTGVRIMTPATAARSVQVMFTPVSTDPDATKRCSAILSGVELRRAECFVTAELKANFIQRRAFRRYCGATALGSSRPLSHVVFDETEKGRPYLTELSDCWFSFSSSRTGLLAAWSSTHAVGVDIEDETTTFVPAELAREYFTNAEAEAIERADGRGKTGTFLKLWCLKEAALKSVGEGLPAGLAAFEFQLSPDLRVINSPREYGGPSQFVPHLLEGTNFQAAMVLRSVS